MEAHQVGGGHGYGCYATPASSSSSDQEENLDLRKGPWTVEEDSLLANYVSVHGEGRWNSLARQAGLYANTNTITI